MKTIKNKAVLDNFNIGFEFEFYVSTKVLLGEQKPKEQVPAEILKQYGHLITVKPQYEESKDHEDAGAYFLKKLKEVYPEEPWAKIFKIESDYSLDDTTSKIGVEMIMKYDIGSKAIAKLVKVFSVLNNPEFSTATECGLHVNMSHVDKKKNKNDMVFSVNQCLDKDKILKTFERTNNDYCVSNDKTSVSSYYLFDDLADNLKNFVNAEMKKATKSKSDYLSYVNLMNFSKNLANATTLQKFRGIINDSIKERFLANWEDDRPAIAPKCVANKNYLEFRMIGGKDYQKKYPQVENSINEYLKAMVKADVIYTKEATKALTAKMK